MQYVVGCSLSFVPRKGSHVADFLAASILKEVNPIGWVTRPLSPLSCFLAIDVARAAAFSIQQCDQLAREGVG